MVCRTRQCSSSR